jgi:hypothetical protein
LNAILGACLQRSDDFGSRDHSSDHSIEVAKRDVVMPVIASGDALGCHYHIIVALIRVDGRHPDIRMGVHPRDHQYIRLDGGKESVEVGAKERAIALFDENGIVWAVRARAESCNLGCRRW